MQSPSRHQRGIALFVGIIMLLVLTLVTVVAFNLSKGSLQIIGNMQHRNEVLAAANAVAEEAMSSTRLYQSPNSVLLNPCNGTPNVRCVDLDGDGLGDVVVTLSPAPVCLQLLNIRNSTLDLNNPDDAGCAIGNGNGSSLVEGANNGNSLCAATLWEINAVGVDAVTETQATVTLGVATRASTACP